MTSQGSYESVKPKRMRPYGPWATLGLTLGIMIAAQVAITVIMIVMMVLMFIGLELANNGQAYILPDNQILEASIIPSIVIGVPLQLGLVWLFIWLRLRDMPDHLKTYLALNIPGIKQVIVGLVALSVFIAMEYAFGILMGRPYPEFTIQLWSMSTWILPFMVILVVICAPIVEEILYRGFMFEGLLKWGAIPAILLSSALWAIIHLQYDWYDILMIFTFGLLLGGIRIWSRSVTLCIFLHFVMNAIALGSYWLVV